MDYKELKNKSESDLHQLLAEKRDEIRELRFKIGERQLKDVSRIKKVKKVVARILTLLTSGKDNDLQKTVVNKEVEKEEKK